MAELIKQMKTSYLVIIIISSVLMISAMEGGNELKRVQIELNELVHYISSLDVDKIRNIVNSWCKKHQTPLDNNYLLTDEPQQQLVRSVSGVLKGFAKKNKIQDIDLKFEARGFGPKLWYVDVDSTIYNFMENMDRSNVDKINLKDAFDLFNETAREHFIIRLDPMDFPDPNRRFQIFIADGYVSPFGLSLAHEFHFGFYKETDELVCGSVALSNECNSEKLKDKDLIDALKGEKLPIKVYTPTNFMEFYQGKYIVSRIDFESEGGSVFLALPYNFKRYRLSIAAPTIEELSASTRSKYMANNHTVRQLFPYLWKQTAYLQTLSIGEFKNYLISEIEKSSGEVSVWGAKFKGEAIIRWGFLFLVAMQAFFIAQHRQLNEFLKAGDFEFFPWLGIYKDKFATTLYMFSLAIPIVSVSYVIVKQHTFLGSFKTYLVFYFGISAFLTCMTYKEALLSDQIRAKTDC